MAIRKIDKIYCSLNLGYIYNVNYSFEPQNGVKISLFFVNETGIYKTNILSPKSKAQIKIANAVFSMYPVKWGKSQNRTEKTIRVDFIDDTHRLRNYYIALTGRACGKNIFQLGKVVDNRTDAEKEKEDPDLFKIREFTLNQDVEYSFKEFLDIVKTVFPVEIKADIDNTITRPFEGTFEEVLSAWCSYFNYSYFFENGSLTIFDPTNLNITFPSIPADAIGSEESESIENTYDKTIWNNFEQDGEEISISADSTANLFIANETLYPWESLSDIKTINNEIYGDIDINQVLAALYGEEFWFLYNYHKGTSAQFCGFNIYGSSSLNFNSPDINDKNNLIKQSLGNSKNIVFLDEEVFNRNFSLYYNYGRNVAGRYYFSKSKLGFNSFNLYSWYDQNGFSSVKIEDLKNRPRISPGYCISPLDSSCGFLEETISENYKGLAFDGQRIFWKDNIDKDFETAFALTDSQKQLIGGFFRRIALGDLGSDSIQWADGSFRDYLICEIISLPSEITNMFNSLSSKIKFLSYRFKNFQMKGYFNADINENVNNLFDDTDIQITSGGPQVLSNTSIIKAKKDSSYIVYLAKFQDCNSESTTAGMLNRRFESIRQSIDIPIPIDITKDSNGVLRTDRDLTFVKKYKDSGILKQFAKAFTIPEKRLSFSLNYFYEGVPVSFISNGLVGLSIDVNENGLTASYSYSNEMLRVPFSNQLVEKLERSLKSSWIRDYIPKRQADI